MRKLHEIIEHERMMKNEMDNGREKLRKIQEERAMDERRREETMRRREEEQRREVQKRVNE